MNIKALLVMAVSSLMIAIPGLANAESVLGIAEAKAAKTQIVQGLQQLIASQKTMSKDQIVAFYKNRTATQLKDLRARGFTQAEIQHFQANIAIGLKAYKSMDKDAIIAAETADLQQVESSDNYLFSFTRLTHYLLNQCKWNTINTPAEGACITGTVLLFPIAAVADVVTLPITLVASLVSGF